MRFFKLMSYFLERNYRGERSSNFILNAVFLSMRYIYFRLLSGVIASTLVSIHVLATKLPVQSGGYINHYAFSPLIFQLIHGADFQSANIKLWISNQ